MRTFLKPQRIWNLSKFLMSRKIVGNYSAKLSYYPSTVALEVTTKCNLACPRCERLVVDKRILGHDTPLEVVKRVLPILKYANSVTLVGGLGEPFKNKHFWDIHRMVAGTGAKVTFITNGLLMTDKNIQKTLDEGTRHIFFSVDSVNPEKYERIKQGTNTENVWNVIRKLISLKKERKVKLPKVVLNYAFQKDTIDEMSDMLELAYEEGVDQVWFTGVITHDAENIPYSFFNLDLNYVREKIVQAQKMADELGIEARFPKTEPFNKPCICSHPFDEMFIFYNGDVCACPHFREPKKYYFYVEDGKLVQKEINYPHLVMGNVLESNILDIWNNKKYTRLRRWIITRFADPAHAPCNTCYYAYGWH